MSDNHAIADRIARSNRRKGGILCPNCAEPLVVYWTRSRPNGCIVRARVCGHCGLKVRTTERREPQPVPPMEPFR